MAGGGAERQYTEVYGEISKRDDDRVTWAD